MALIGKEIGIMSNPLDMEVFMIAVEAVFIVDLCLRERKWLMEQNILLIHTWLSIVGIL